MESIIIAERAILYTLAFQIKIELPQNSMFQKLKLVGVYTFSAPGPGSTPPANLPKEKETKLSQLAVNFSNDRCFLKCHAVCYLFSFLKAHAFTRCTIVVMDYKVNSLQLKDY